MTTIGVEQHPTLFMKVRKDASGASQAMYLLAWIGNPRLIEVITDEWKELHLPEPRA